MAILNVLKRISKEDFPSKYQDLVAQLSSPINQFIEQVIVALNRNLTIEDNLPFQIKTIQLSVNASGIPKSTVAFKTVLKSVRGIWVIKADNLTDTTALSGAPFVQSQTINGIVTISKIYGLPADKTFSLTFMLVD